MSNVEADLAGFKYPGRHGRSGPEEMKIKAVNGLLLTN